jgi:hypothetical protein
MKLGFWKLKITAGIGNNQESAHMTSLTNPISHISHVRHDAHILQTQILVEDLEDLVELMNDGRYCAVRLY